MRWRPCVRPRALGMATCLSDVLAAPAPFSEIENSRRSNVKCVKCVLSFQLLYGKTGFKIPTDYLVFSQEWWVVTATSSDLDATLARLSSWAYRVALRGCWTSGWLRLQFSLTPQTSAVLTMCRAPSPGLERGEASLLLPVSVSPEPVTARGGLTPARSWCRPAGVRFRLGASGWRRCTQGRVHGV